MFSAFDKMFECITQHQIDAAVNQSISDDCGTAEKYSYLAGDVVECAFRQECSPRLVFSAFDKLFECIKQHQIDAAVQ